MAANTLIIAGIAGLFGFLVWDMVKKGIKADPPVEKSQQMSKVSGAKGTTRIWAGR